MDSSNNPAQQPAQTSSPARASSNPMAAAILGAMLVREGQRQYDPATTQAGHNLLRVAQDHWPTPIPQDKRLPR